jgi:transcriptional regulator with XRE-family HTH domain
MKEIAAILGKSIKSRRQLLKIKQEDLAEVTGISSKTIRNIERGEANPELKSLITLCDALGLDIKIKVKE